MKPAILNWSGGKDSSLTLYYLNKSKEFDIKYLLTTINQQFDRISMHGVRRDLLERQAESIGIALEPILVPEMPTMQIYDDLMAKTLRRLSKEGIKHSIFGDIFLEDLRKYREDQLTKVNLEGLFPLWKRSTTDLLKEFVDVGFKSVLVCINEKFLDKSFAGREIDEQFIKDLPAEVDPCGENGEFHTFVYDGPIFKNPIPWKKGEIVYKKYEPPPREVDTSKDSYHQCSSDADFSTGFWYCDLIPE